MSEAAIWGVGVVEDTNLLEFSGSVTSTVFNAAVAAADAGPLTVRPTGGVGTFTVTGTRVNWDRQDVTIQNAIIEGDIEYNETDGLTAAASGFVLDNCTVHSFQVDGADDWLMTGCTFDLDAISLNGIGSNIIYAAENWQILNCDFLNYYVEDDPGIHTEALSIRRFVDGGLIDGCTFDNNGTTASIFWTWYPLDDPPTYPKNMCVQNCSFTNSHNAFWHLDARNELPNDLTLNIRVDDATCTWDATAASLFSNHDNWLVPC